MSDVTELLLRWNDGDEAGRAALVDRVYDELNAIATRQLSKEFSTNELQPTVLVHECYMRLVDMDRISWQGKAHFLALSARLMRQIIVDEARRRKAAKRGNGLQLTLHSMYPDEEPGTNVLALHEALERLATADPERASLVELRYFGGLTIDETATVLGKSAATVKRSWDVARGWLFREMNREARC